MRKPHGSLEGHLTHTAQQTQNRYTFPFLNPVNEVPMTSRTQQHSPHRLRPLSKLALGLVLTSGLILTGCTTDAPPPPPPEPQEHAMLPQLSLQEDVLVQKAGDYIQAHKIAQNSARTPLTGVSTMEMVIKNSTPMDISRISQGYVAYMGLIAAQDAEFVAAVREMARTHGPAAVGRRLALHPDAVYQFNGARTAAARVTQALNRVDQSYEAIGKKFTSEAYSLQSQRWAKNRARVGSRTATLKAVSAKAAPVQHTYLQSLQYYSTPSPKFDTEAAQRNQGALLSLTNMQDLLSTAPTQAATAKQTPLVTTALTLAAYKSLNMAPHPDMVKNPRLNQCLDMARLQLFQCFSAVHYRYEEPFCLGRHAYNDVGDCLSGR